MFCQCSLGSDFLFHRFTKRKTASCQLLRSCGSRVDCGTLFQNIHQWHNCLVFALQTKDKKLSNVTPGSSGVSKRCRGKTPVLLFDCMEWKQGVQVFVLLCVVWRFLDVRVRTDSVLASFSKEEAAGLAVLLGFRLCLRNVPSGWESQLATESVTGSNRADCTLWRKRRAKRFSDCTKLEMMSGCNSKKVQKSKTTQKLLEWSPTTFLALSCI